MKTHRHNYSAAMALVGHIAVDEEKAENPLTGAVPNQAKAFFLRIPLETTTKQHPLKGFFTPIAAVLRTKAANLNRLLGVKDRPPLPLGARLANLVEVSHNLCKQSGRKFALRNRINPSLRTWSGNRWSGGQEHLSSLAP